MDPRSQKRAKPGCKLDECPNEAVGKSGLCISHGGGKRCQEPGCHKGAVPVAKGAVPVRSTPDRCSKHGGGHRCEEAGCNKGARGLTGRCLAHGSQPRAMKELRAELEAERTARAKLEAELLTSQGLIAELRAELEAERTARATPEPELAAADELEAAAYLDGARDQAKAAFTEISQRASELTEIFEQIAKVEGGDGKVANSAKARCFNRLGRLFSGGAPPKKNGTKRLPPPSSYQENYLIVPGPVGPYRNEVDREACRGDGLCLIWAVSASAADVYSRSEWSQSIPVNLRSFFATWPAKELAKSGDLAVL